MPNEVSGIGAKARAMGDVINGCFLIVLNIRLLTCSLSKKNKKRLSHTCQGVESRFRVG